MKLNKIFSALMLIAAVAFTACEENIINPDNGGNTGGKDTAEVVKSDTLTVADILSMNVPDKDTGTEKYWVKAYIVGSYNYDNEPKFVIGSDNASNSSLLLADDPASDDTYSVASVKLPIGIFREKLNLVSHPENYQKEIILYGVVEKYCGIGGIVKIEKAYLDGVLIESTPVAVGDTLTVANLIQMTNDGTMPEKDAGTAKHWVTGYIVGYYDFNAADKFVLGSAGAATTNILIADDPETTDTYSVASVKLPAGDLRDLINLADNPQNLKQAFKVYGVVEKYCGIGGVVKIEEAYINGVKVEKHIDLPTIDYEAGELSVTDFLALDAIKNLASGETTTDEYTVRGVVKTVQKVNLANGQAQFYITDGVNDLLCYDIFALNGEKFVHADQLKEGDIVTVQSVVTNYNGTIEPKGGKITRTTNTFVPKTTGPKVVTIAEALEISKGLATGETTPDQYQIKGLVTEVKEASTSYGNLTFYIKDDSTTETFYIYRVYYLDNKKYTDADPVLEVDDKVTVIGQIQNYNGTIELVQGYISEHLK